MNTLNINVSCPLRTRIYLEHYLTRGTPFSMTYYAKPPQVLYNPIDGNQSDKNR